MPLSTTVLLCVITAVSDGDSLRARCPENPTGRSTQAVKVRIANIDAPELQQAYGRSAKAHLAQLCLKRDALIYPVAIDSYGRLIAHVRCQSQDAANAQLSAGLAWLYTRDGQARRRLTPLQTQAQNAHTGLWAQTAPLAPWDYRKRYGTFSSQVKQ